MQKISKTGEYWARIEDVDGEGHADEYCFYSEKELVDFLKSAPEAVDMTEYVEAA